MCLRTAPPSRIFVSSCSSRSLPRLSRHSSPRPRKDHLCRAGQGILEYDFHRMPQRSIGPGWVASLTRPPIQDCWSIGVCSGLIRHFQERALILREVSVSCRHSRRNRARLAVGLFRMRSWQEMCNLRSCWILRSS